MIGSAQKLAPNKKRPGLFRVLGRPNSPPPELLTFKVRAGPESADATFVPWATTTGLLATFLPGTYHEQIPPRNLGTLVRDGAVEPSSLVIYGEEWGSSVASFLHRLWKDEQGQDIAEYA